jgi:hypothetical protein
MIIWHGPDEIPKTDDLVLALLESVDTYHCLVPSYRFYVLTRYARLWSDKREWHFDKGRVEEGTENRLIAWAELPKPGEVFDWR